MRGRCCLLPNSCYINNQEQAGFQQRCKGASAFISTGNWGRTYIGFSLVFCKTPALSWSHLSWVFSSSHPPISRWHSAGQKLCFFCPWVLGGKAVGGGMVNTRHGFAHGGVKSWILLVLAARCLWLSEQPLWDSLATLHRKAGICPCSATCN